MLGGMERVSTTSYVLPQNAHLHPSAPVLETVEITHQSAQGESTGKGQAMFSNYSNFQTVTGSSLDSSIGIKLWQWQLERVKGPPAE